jgi:molecular chaperone DnaJ
MAPQREWLEKDYYATLGVSKDATADEIKKAYRKLARENHPDANPDDPKAEQRFKEIGEAYAIVGDKAQRTEYDEMRRLGGAGMGGYGGFGGMGGFGGADLGDILGQVFNARGGGAGAGAGRQRPRRGNDVETDVHLTFEDALAGVSTTIAVAGEGPCSACKGSGAAQGSSRVTCTTCAGRGEVTVDQGMFSFAQPCGRCGGQGTMVEKPCRTCRGVGRVSTQRQLQVRIPAGVRDGAVIRLAGRGQAGRGGGPAGDVLVKVHVAAHPRFGRRGDDVTIDLPLTFTEAALGTTVAVPVPSGGRRRIRVAAGTQPGKVLRVRGEGAPARRGSSGDLLVTIRVMVPDKLSREQKKLLAQLAELEDAAARDRALFDGHPDAAPADGAQDASDPRDGADARDAAEV